MSAVRLVLGPLGRRGTYLALLYLALGVPLGLAWLALLVTGYATALGLTVTLIGIPLLLGVTYAAISIAAVERTLVRVLLGAEIESTRRPLRGGLLARLWGWLRDPSAWRELAYVALRATAGVAIGIAVLVALQTCLMLVAYPTYYWVGDGDVVVGNWSPDTIGWALLASLIGLVLLPIVAWAVVGLGILERCAAEALLGRVPGRPLHRPSRAARVMRPRAVALHAAIAGAIVVVCVGIWGVTTPGGYFWPVWVAFGLSIPLGVHALAVYVPRPAGRGVALPLTALLAGFVFVELTIVWALSTPGGYFWPAWVLLGLAIPVGIHASVVVVPDARPAWRGLMIHAAVSGLLIGGVVVIWAGTTPGGYFWPAWVALGLLLLVGAHALVTGLRDRGGDPALERRVEVLATTRAAAVDAQGAELRRIERDLHDGAQARLTALAMELGMAREKIDSEPADAAPLVAQAHEEAKRVLVELRDLARGIHPAVLTDRGLDAALSALAGASPISVALSVDTGGRLPAAVEAAAYFVVAEALANAHKHSDATQIHIAVARPGRTLVVSVSDDGVGGADRDGDGLEGLRRRVEALDGRLDVTSTPDAGTTVQAEIPCES